MINIKLVAPDIIVGDAVGNFCLELVRIFNSRNFVASAYASRYSIGVFDISQFAQDLTPKDIIIVSFSIYDPLLLDLSKLSNYKICYYHGITPPKYLSEHDPITAELCESGLNQRYLISAFDHVICNSSDTAKSILKFVDSKSLKVLPPITQNILFVKKNSLHEIKNLSNSLKIIVLGRVVPHKGIEDCVLLLKLLIKYGINANLDLVGSLGHASYIDHIIELSFRLCVNDKINFYGYVDEEKKSMLLEGANLFFSASYHEGFGVPILEAMGYGLPIMVRSKTISNDIGKHCITYTTVEDAAVKIKKLISNNNKNKQIDNFKFYNYMFEKCSDESIYNFFSSKIFKENLF